jgi:hypothetical protein
MDELKLADEIQITLAQHLLSRGATVIVKALPALDPQLAFLMSLPKNSGGALILLNSLSRYWLMP